MNAFTSESSGITSKTIYSCFYAETDSRGRITIPARLRGSEADLYEVNLRPVSRDVFEVEDAGEAVEILSGFEKVNSFRFSGGRLEVFTDER